MSHYKDCNKRLVANRMQLYLLSDSYSLTVLYKQRKMIALICDVKKEVPEE